MGTLKLEDSVFVFHCISMLPLCGTTRRLVFVRSTNVKPSFKRKATIVSPTRGPYNQTSNTYLVKSPTRRARDNTTQTNVSLESEIREFKANFLQSGILSSPEEAG